MSLCAKATPKRVTRSEVGIVRANATSDTKPSVPGVRGYLSMAVAPNGLIYLVGTRIYEQMGAAAFNEAWVREGKPPVR